MSKKYFINNLDTSFGQAFIQELVKQPTEDPLHMCTVRVPVDAKPNGIKKILKREKPKLFKKKAIEECEVYIYNLDQTEISDVQFGIQMMKKPFEDTKVFIFVSDIMAWSNSGKKIKKDVPPPAEEGGAQPAQQNEAKPPQDEQKVEAQGGSQADLSEKDPEPIEEKPIQYTFWEDADFADRVPLEKYQYIKDIEDKVLSIKRQNVKVFIICPGIIYGCGEDTFYPLFKAAWIQQPEKLPYLNEGSNKIPTIHMKDLVKFVIKVAESPPEGPPYLLAIDESDDKTQKSIISAISKGVGSGKIESKAESHLIENPDRYLIDIDIKSSKVLIGTPEQPVQFEWVARKGVHQNIKSLLKDYCDKEKLRPIKLLMLQTQFDWKNSKIEYILKTFSEYYRIPVLTIKGILQSAKEHGDEQLIQDLKDEWEEIMNYVNGQIETTTLDQALKVFYRAIRWRLSQNDCSNRGFILENFPKFESELGYIFNKISLKKFKRKKPKKVIQTSLSVPQSVKSLARSSMDDENGEAPPPEEPPAEQPPKEEEPKQEEPPEEQPEGEETGPKIQLYYPESIISIKRMGTKSLDHVIDFFTSKGMEELVYDTTGMKEHQIFESLRNYIERNGRPNNYLISEAQLLERHAKFTADENVQSLRKKEDAQKAKKKAISDHQAKRKKLCEEIIEIVRNEGEQEIKKMPFRNYLMEFVVPTLNVGLLEVSNIIPNDPVDLLAEFLYQRSYDV